MSTHTRRVAGRIMAVIALAVAMVAGTTGAAHAALVHWPSHYVNYQIVNLRSGKCVEVYGISTADGADVVQWSCWGGYNQHWRLIPVGGIWHEIRNRHSDKCLEIAGHSNAHLADVVQWTCWGGWNQQWALYGQGNQILLYPRHVIEAGLNRCADVLGYSVADAADVILADCYSTTNQLFGFYTT